MDNAHLYGFRWSRAANGSDGPKIVEKVVASGYAALADSGGTDYVDLRVGDPIGLLSTGYVELANAGDLVWGIIMGIKQYWDGEKIVLGDRVPYGRTYPSQERETIILVAEVTQGFWEIDCDENTTAATYAAYFALIGENCPHVCAGVNVGGVKPSADPMLDISGHAATAGLEWRIEGISQSMENRDFTGAYTKLIVKSNASQNAGVAATPVLGV